MDKKQITRIDFERIGQPSVMVRKWYAGYNIHDAGPANSEEFLENVSIPALLAEYEKQGYCVWMGTPSQGRAIKGAITRIDVIKVGQEWVVKKYCYGWSAKTPPIETKPMNDQQARDAIQWLKDNQWSVMEHPNWNGARAFKGHPIPVREKSAILRMRRDAQDRRENYTADFAYLF